MNTGKNGGILLLVAAVLTAVFSGCGTETKQPPAVTEIIETEETPTETEAVSTEEEPVFRGRVLVSLPENTWRWEKNGDFFKERFENAGYQCKVLYPEGEGSDRQEQLFSEAEFGVDLIILSPSDTDDFSSVAAYADEKGTLVVVYDRPLSKMPENSYYVGFSGDFGDTRDEALVVYSVGLDLLSEERPDAALIRASGWDFPCTFDALCRDCGGKPAFIL